MEHNNLPENVNFLYNLVSYGIGLLFSPLLFNLKSKY